MRPSFVPLSALAFFAAVPIAAGVFAPGSARAQAPNAPPAPGAPQSPATPAAPNAPSSPAAPGTAPGTPGTTGGSTPGTAPGTGGVSGQNANGQNTATAPANQTGQLSTGGSVPRPTANPSPVYDVSRAIQEAIGASSELILTRRIVQIDENRADDVASAAKFNVNGNASATRFDQATQIAIGGGPPIQVVPSHQEALSLVVSQRLDFLGQIRAETRQARLQTEADRANLDRIVNDRTLQAQQIFYNLLRATHQVQVAQSALTSAQSQETIARRLYEGQIGQKIDYLRASTQTAQAVQDLQRAENDLGLARASFNDLVGKPLGSPVEPVDVPGVSVGADVPRPASVPVGDTPPASGRTPVVVPAAPARTVRPAAPQIAPPGTQPGVAPASGGAVSQVAPTTAPYVPFAPPVGEVESIDVNQATQTAQNNRPEVRRNAVLLRAAETGIQVARSGQQPSFALSASGNYYPTTSFQFPRQRTAAITASVSIPFYDGGATKARINEARLQTENARTAFGSSQSGVALEVQQAYLTLSTAARQITAANAAVEQAIAARQLAQIRYEGQVGLFLEVTDAQAALVRAESAQVNSVYDYLIARAQFVNAVGSPTYLTATAPPPALLSGAAPTPAVPATPAPPIIAPNAPTTVPATPQK